MCWYGVQNACVHYHLWAVFNTLFTKQRDPLLHQLYSLLCVFINATFKTVKKSTYCIHQATASRGCPKFAAKYSHHAKSLAKHCFQISWLGPPDRRHWLGDCGTVSRKPIWHSDLPSYLNWVPLTLNRTHTLHVKKVTACVTLVNLWMRHT